MGDRAAHQPVKHFAQLVYFGLFSATFLLAPMLTGHVSARAWACVWAPTPSAPPEQPQINSAGCKAGPPQRKPSALESAHNIPTNPTPAIQSMLILALATALGSAALYFAPAPHPYLLADNRHFTFYIWRRVLRPSPHPPTLQFWSSSGLFAPVLASISEWGRITVLATMAAAAWVYMVRRIVKMEVQWPHWYDTKGWTGLFCALLHVLCLAAVSA